MESLLGSASKDLPNLEEDDGNHDLRGETDDLKEMVKKPIPDSTGKDIKRPANPAVLSMMCSSEKSKC